MRNKTREERKRDRATYSASVSLLCFSLILILWGLHTLGVLG